MNMKTMIISAFPSCGKTYLYKNQNELTFPNCNGKLIHYSFIDSESSKYEKCDGWEKRYVDDIISHIGTVDFIFIALKDTVLNELASRNIPFITVAPDSAEYTDESERAEKHMLVKQQWIGRIILRNNSHIHDFPTWLNKLIENWDDWVSVDAITKCNPVTFFQLQEDQYLSDIIANLYIRKEKYANKYCI